MFIEQKLSLLFFNTMATKTYNYAIIGAGGAGIHLAMAMMADDFFSDKEILIVEKESKSENDRTWCFWEAGTGKWDALLHHSWAKGSFHSSEIHQALAMPPYRYKMLRSIDFYNHAKNKLAASDHFHWVQDSIEKVSAGSPSVLHGAQAQYQAEHIFDSRIDAGFYENKDSYTRLLQHFKGWMIETEEDFFDPEEFVMMDFRLKWKDSTSFNYVLPISRRTAMVEFTLFTEDLVTDDTYDKILKQYFEEYLQLKKYKVTEVEKGVIPMSDFPFHKQHQNHLTKIGTAGGWVRPSSGYFFKNAEGYCQQVIDNLKAGRLPSKGVAQSRFRFYDSLLLDILKNKNEMGEDLFTSMFGKNSATQIFKFLDEETSLSEEIKIFWSFRSGPFLWALWRWFLG